MIESIEKSQESIRKNRNPHRVIPAQAGIQKHNAAGLYRKKQKPHRRHSRKSGNPATEKPQESISKNRNPTASFPRRRESKNATQQEFIGKNRNPHRVIPAQAGIQKHNATGIYRKKQNPPPPSFPRKRESRPVGTETYRIKQFP
ncbi:putative phage associated protein [Neisseria meningitidis]|uniref:hypothetical protein n=1 Tax=Neisseria meningitidis TaxID=487 RepID=UPI0007668036|nr:hypothetical protein [Neisseria meningitidis]CWN56683.1 putative phage associated protein [Neisseria meningitidis]CWR25583.1 putative phage associated protein [Neisseria meningitidis]CWS13853.1 putative phage associated protein [Neisseria meningitidis]